MKHKDYYATLGVNKTATQEQIKQKYRDLSKVFHQDRNVDTKMESKVEEEYKEINEAYAVLSDVSHRNQYDLDVSRSNAQQLNGLSFSIQNIPENSDASQPSTSLIAYQAYNLLEILQQGKIDKEELINDALNNKILADKILEDKEVTHFLGNKVEVLREHASPTTAQERKYDSATSREDKKALKKINKNLAALEKAIKSKSSALEFLSNKELMDDLRFYPGVLYKLANVDVEIFYKVLKIQNAEWVLDRANLDSLVKKYDLTPQSLPEEDSTIRYKLFHQVENLLLNYNNTEKENKKIAKLFAEISLSYSEFLKLYKDPVCKMIFSTYDDVIFAMSSYDFEKISYELDLPTIILHNKKLFDKVADKDKYIIDIGVKDIELCSYILTSDLKSHVSGKGLDTFITLHGNKVAQIIEMDPELSQTFSAYKKYMRARTQGFTQVSQQVVTAFKNVDDAQMYFLKGEDYSTSSFTFAAEFYYKAACLEHEEALTRLSSQFDSLDNDYQNKVADLYNNRAMSFYDPAKALAFYKKMTPNSKNEIQTKYYINQIAAYITNCIYNNVDYKLAKDENVIFLEAILNDAPTVTTPIFEYLARSLARLCFAVNATPDAYYYLCKVETFWDAEDVDRIFDLHIQALECQFATPHTIGKIEEGLLYFPLIKLDNIVRKYISYINNATDTKKIKTFIERLNILLKFGNISGETANSIFQKAYLVEKLPKETIIKICQSNLKKLNDASISVAAKFIQDSITLYKLGRIAIHKGAKVDITRLFWEKALEFANQRDKPKYTELLYYYHNLPFVFYDALVGYEEGIEKISLEKLFELPPLSGRAWCNETPLQLLIRMHHNKIIEKLIVRGLDLNIIDPNTGRPILERNYSKSAKEFSCKIAADNLSLFAINAIHIDSLHGNQRANALIQQFIPYGKCHRKFNQIARINLLNLLNKIVNDNINFQQADNGNAQETIYSQLRLSNAFLHEINIAKEFINTSDPTNGHNYLHYFEKMIWYFSKGKYIKREISLRKRHHHDVFLVDSLIQLRHEECYDTFASALIHLCLATSSYAHATLYMLYLETPEYDYKQFFDLNIKLIELKGLHPDARKLFALRLAHHVNDDDIVLHIGPVLRKLHSLNELGPEFVKIIFLNDFLLIQYTQQEIFEISKKHFKDFLRDCNFSAIIKIANYIKDPKQLYILGRELALLINICSPLVQSFWAAALNNCTGLELQRFQDLNHYHPYLPLDFCDAIVGFCAGLLAKDKRSLHCKLSLNGSEVTPLLLLARYHHNQIIELLIKQNVNFNFIDPNTSKPVLEMNYKNNKAKWINRILEDKLSLYAVAAMRIDHLHGNKRATYFISRFVKDGQAQQYYNFLEQQDKNRDLQFKIMKYITNILNRGVELQNINTTYELGENLVELSYKLKQPLIDANENLEKTDPTVTNKILLNIIKSNQQTIQAYAEKIKKFSCQESSLYLVNIAMSLSFIGPLINKHYTGNYFFSAKAEPIFEESVKETKRLLFNGMSA